MKKTLKYVLAATVLVSTLGALASCGGGGSSSSGSASGSIDPSTGVHTYNTYTPTSPSNWNELTYQDQNDLQILSYISGSFFKYDFQFDEDGQPIEGKYAVKYDAATKLEDVTEAYRGVEKWGIPESGTGYAYKITLRDDIKWDDGTAISAKDWVYTMKQQLDPKFKNYRADSYYNGANVLHNAKNYAYQGMKGWYPSTDIYSKYEDSLGDKLIFTLANAKENESKGGKVTGLVSAWGEPDQNAREAATAIAEFLTTDLQTATTPEEIIALEGKTMTQIKANGDYTNTLNKFKLIQKLISDNSPVELFSTLIDYEWAAVNFDDVGIQVGDNDNELVIILDRPLQLLEADGSLSFKAAYNLASLPVVKEKLYEDNKVAPVEGSTLWTTTYNSSVASTASWGPYKLTSFQSGKQYVLERNPYWYGYNKPENKGKYQTDRIVCQTLKEWNTAWLAFQKGEVDEIGIDVSIAKDYKNSSQAIFTPSDFVGSLQLQSNKEALKKHEKDGVNKTILAQPAFRKAISLGINRKEYNEKCTTSSKPGFGLFNSMHYYDVEHNGVYRDTDEAKKVLCETYGVDYNDPKYGGSLDKAVASITGYDPEQAKALVNEAYDAALAAGDIKATDKVVLEFGSGAQTESIMRAYNFLSDALKEMVKGTKLDGRLDTSFKNYEAKWANEFRAGSYEICTGGWSGAAWDPGYFLLAYLSPDYMYSQAWETDKQMLELTVPGVGEGGTDLTLNMSLIDWYNCLNGAEKAAHNFSEGVVSTKARLVIISALEKAVLTQYYTVPLQNGYSASLISYKTEQITRDYNTFMSYGGLEYMTYNYNDEQWAEYVKTQGGKLDYTK